MKKRISKWGKVILAMPVFNEKEVIEEVVRKNHAYTQRFKNGQLLISEDGSNDGTKEILQKLKKELKFVLRATKKRQGAVQGQKNALNYALQEGADIVLLSDSDNQHDPSDFGKLFNKLKDNDFVLGHKYPRNDPFWRKYGSKVWNFYTRILFGMRLHDINCGFRMMKRKPLMEILPQCNLFQECFPSEMSIRAKFAGYKLDEVKIHHFMRGDKPKAWNPRKIPAIALNLLFKSLKLRKKLFFNREGRVDRMNKTYNKYYEQGYSFRDDWFGPVTKEYILPKYIKLATAFIKNNNQKVSILELGAGDGEVTDLIREKRPKWNIVPTEVVESAVKSLRKKGYKDAALADATNLPFVDNSFDYVICFDVMHHVDGPAKMASEMARVARRGVFLIEANRKSIARRLLEKTNKYKQAGESSYYPMEYKAFFKLPNIKEVRIEPFQFIPPKLSNINLPLTIAISEFIAKLPILRWQCSGVAIEVVKDY